MSAALQALADRCASAPGPSLELDRDIVSVVVGNDAARRIQLHGNQRYTASIDAALTLVPEETRWQVGNDGYHEDYGVAEIIVAGKQFSEEANTFALALCAAALRARAYLTAPDPNT